MNIIITLPTMLADLIYEGQKTIEVRKRWPKHFDPKDDVVYICEKGTGLVTGLLIINGMTISNSPSYTWHAFKDRICIEKEWFTDYLKDCKTHYLWHIRQAERFVKPYSLTEVFGVKSAPQSYVYTDVDWFIEDDCMITVETKSKIKKNINNFLKNL